MEKEINWLLTEKYQGLKSEDFYNDCKRLQQGEPLAYLIGHIPFLDTTIYLNTRPLIPRVETEFWTQQLIEILKEEKREPRNILDLCAGSGCMGVALGRAFSGSHISFAEIDETHKTTIALNCQANGLLTEHYTIYTGDLFSAISQTRQFDLIVSNPPYLDKENDQSESSVRKYEPFPALYAPNQGFFILERIINEAKNYLTKDGLLLLEHEPKHAPMIQKIGAPEWKMETWLDQYNQPRTTCLSVAK